MNWIKSNPFLAALAAISLIGAGALGYLLSQSLGQYREASEGYEQAVKTLHGLQNRTPFPSQPNLDAARNAQEEYKRELDALRSQLAGMETPLDPNIKPQQFQDDLRKAVNDVSSQALAAGVKLPENFYLGFDQYEATPPTDRAAPALARQLGIIHQCVTHLIEYKVDSIDDLKRPPLPEESAAGARPPATPGTGRARPNERDRGVNSATPLLLRYPFDVAFTADQSKFRVALNSLLDSDQFLIVRTVNIRNTNLAGPPVVSEEAASGAPSPEAGQSAEAKNLNVLLGRESLKIALGIEIIDFMEPARP